MAEVTDALLEECATVKEAAERLGCVTSGIYRLIRAGKVESLTVPTTNDRGRPMVQLITPRGLKQLQALKSSRSRSSAGGGMTYSAAARFMDCNIQTVVGLQERGLLPEVLTEEVLAAYLARRGGKVTRAVTRPDGTVTVTELARRLERPYSTVLVWQRRGLIPKEVKYEELETVIAEAKRRIAAAELKGTPHVGRVLN